MNSYHPSAQPNTRVDAADLLRGVAVGGIVLLHFIEHLNFYSFPEPTKLDGVVWDVAFFLLSSKMYAIFAMLFGLTLFIQHDNQAKRGFDFRPRFVWRMVLLFGFGLLDLLFFNGDILTVYAVCGVLVLPLVRASDRVLLAVAALLALQPVEIVYFVGGLVNPQLQSLNLGSGELFRSIMPAQEGGNWLDVAVAGLRYGLPVNFTWAIEHGRMTQTLFLFLLGVWIGRRRFLYDEGGNALLWRRTMLWSVAAFALFCPLRYTVPQLVGSECASAALTVMLDMWKNLSMTLFYVSSLTYLYHRTRARGFLAKILPYGKMSLTNYIGQSVVGGFVFYHWGLSLYSVSGHTMSLAIGAVFVLLQFTFCRLWLRSHKRGPLEQLWHKATWAGSAKPKR